MTRPGPTLETDRLILRPTAAEDFEPWAAVMADPQVARYIGGLQSRHGAWRGFLAPASRWVRVVRSAGPAALERVYQDVLAGRAAPDQGHVVSPRA